MKFSIFQFGTLLILLSITTNCFADVADTIEIKEIEVTANLIGGELKNVSGSISLITSEELENSDRIIIANQLNTLPGVYMHSGSFNTNRIVIRGIGSRTPYSSNRIKAYLNDIPLTNGDGVTTIEDIEVARIGRIEVMKGPTSAIYGSGLGGTIKLSTFPVSNNLRVNVQTGSFKTYNASLLGGFSHNGNNLSASVHQQHSNGFRENNQFDRSSTFITGNYVIQQTRLDFTLAGIFMNAQIPSSINKEMFLNSPEKAAPNWLNASGNEQRKQLISGVTALHNFSENISDKLTLFAGYNNSFEHRPFNNLADRSINYGIRNQFKYTQNTFNLIAGLELYQESYLWETSLNSELISKVEETRRYANTFLLVENQPHEKWHITAALNLNRLNYQYASQANSYGNYSYPFRLSPRFGFNYARNENLNIYGSIGHGFSAPSLEETLLPEGTKNDEILPETGVMSEVGIRYINRVLFLDATIYHVSVYNLLVTKRISEEQFMGVNAGKSAHSGVEVQANYTVFDNALFPGKLIVKTAITLSKNMFVDFIDEGKNYSTNQLPGIPVYSIISGFKWNPVDYFSLNYLQQMQGKQFMNDSNSEQYSAYLVANLNINYQCSISDQVRIQLIGGLNNAFNSMYASMILVNATGFGGSSPRYYYPGQPRNWYVSIILSV